jgi:hypothetical protein
MKEVVVVMGMQASNQRMCAMADTAHILLPQQC